MKKRKLFTRKPTYNIGDFIAYLFFFVCVLHFYTISILLGFGIMLPIIGVSFLTSSHYWPIVFFNYACNPKLRDKYDDSYKNIQQWLFPALFIILGYPLRFLERILYYKVPIAYLNISGMILLAGVYSLYKKYKRK